MDLSTAGEYETFEVEEIARDRDINKIAVIKLLESLKIPFNDDIIDEHLEGVENLMDLSTAGEYETFEDALEAWSNYENFSVINNKRRGGKKKKKKTRRKRKKKKKKTRRKK